MQLIHLALVFVLLHLLLRKTQMVSDLRLAHFCQDKYLGILRFIWIWLNRIFDFDEIGLFVVFKESCHDSFRDLLLELFVEGN